jgi:hypothetical protein
VRSKISSHHSGVVMYLSSVEGSGRVPPGSGSSGLPPGRSRWYRHLDDSQMTLSTTSRDCRPWRGAHVAAARCAESRPIRTLAMSADLGNRASTVWLLMYFWLLGATGGLKQSETSVTPIQTELDSPVRRRRPRNSRSRAISGDPKPQARRSSSPRPSSAGEPSPDRLLHISGHRSYYRPLQA